MEKTNRLSFLWVLGLSALFFVLFLLISGALYSSASSSWFGGRGAVGVIEVKGIILDSKKTLAKLEKLEEDDRVQAVVLRLNSPGGAVAPSQEIYEGVRGFKKPLVVSMGNVAASGAYWIACGAQKVFANPGTLTGSVGVIMQFVNLHKLYEWAKIDRYSIKSGPFKDAGSEYRKLTPQEEELFQKMVGDILAQFKSVVSMGRNLPMDKVNEIADGRVFTGNQAKNLQLVDELGTLHDAIQTAAQMAHIKGKPEVVYIEKPKNKLLDLFTEDDSETGSYYRGGVGSLVNFFSFLFPNIVNQSGADGMGEAADFAPGLYSIWGR